MCGRYRLHRVGPQTKIGLHLRSAAGGDESEAETSDAETADDETVNETDDALRVDLRLWPHEAEAVVRGLLSVAVASSKSIWPTARSETRCRRVSPRVSPPGRRRL